MAPKSKKKEKQIQGGVSSSDFSENNNEKSDFSNSKTLSFFWVYWFEYRKIQFAGLFVLIFTTFSALQTKIVKNTSPGCLNPHIFYIIVSEFLCSILYQTLSLLKLSIISF